MKKGAPAQAADHDASSKKGSAETQKSERNAAFANPEVVAEPEKKRRGRPKKLA